MSFFFFYTIRYWLRIGLWVENSHPLHPVVPEVWGNRSSWAICRHWTRDLNFTQFLQIPSYKGGFLFSVTEKGTGLLVPALQITHTRSPWACHVFFVGHSFPLLFRSLRVFFFLFKPKWNLCFVPAFLKILLSFDNRNYIFFSSIFPTSLRESRPLWWWRWWWWWWWWRWQWKLRFIEFLLCHSACQHFEWIALFHFHHKCEIITMILPILGRYDSEKSIKLPSLIRLRMDIMPSNLSLSDSKWA